MHSRSKHKTETIKLLEENIGRTLSNINHSKIVYDPPPRVMEIKTKVNKWDLIKSFCTSKETISKVKRQPSEWEKTFANRVTDKALISKIHKQLMQLSFKTIKTQPKIGQKIVVDISPKKTYRWSNLHKKMLNITNC